MTKMFNHLSGYMNHYSTSSISGYINSTKLNPITSHLLLEKISYRRPVAYTHISFRKEKQRTIYLDVCLSIQWYLSFDSLPWLTIEEKESHLANMIQMCHWINRWSTLYKMRLFVTASSFFPFSSVKWLIRNE